jgi:prevent-host-death family protein
MKTMLVSEFKARCLAVLKEVQRTREPLVVTLRGKPLVTVVPADVPGSGKRLGGLKGRMTVRRDLVKIDTTADWEMSR